MDPIEVVRRRRNRRGILDEIPGILTLEEPFGRERIRVFVKGPEHTDKLLVVAGHGLVIRKLDIRTRKSRHGLRKVPADVTDPPDPTEVLMARELFRQFQNAPLGHSVNQNVGLGVKENRTPDGIGPPVIV